VFWNVLKNAQKFSAEGRRISIRSFNDGEKLLFEIKDSGKGIEPELLPKIFEAFAQGEAPADGLGLGLAISKAIIETHGGRIRAFSKGIGTGATFTIELMTGRRESTP
jgi:two-component system CheB/CheR fusion protein